MKKKAFTLIELLIVIAIISILSAVVVVFSSKARNKKAVETASREVAAAIRQTQNNALSGKNAGAACNSYVFSYVAGSNGYVITCTPSGTTENFYLKNGVKFQDNSGSISFSIPFGSPTFSSITANTVKVGKNATCYQRILVNSAGNISEELVSC